MPKPRFHDRFLELLAEHRLTSDPATAEALDRPLKAARPRAHKPLSVQQIQRWRDYTKGTPSPKILRALAEYFGVTVDYLTGGSDKKAPDDLAQALADYVNREFNARPVYRGRVRRGVHKANGQRLLQFVIEAVRAAEKSDNELTAQEGTTHLLYGELAVAAQLLETAGKKDEAKHARLKLRRVDKASEEQLTPRLIRLFDAAVEAPLPSLTITTTAPSA